MSTSVINNGIARPEPRSFDVNQIGDEMVSFYREHGFAIIRDAIEPAKIDRVNREALLLCRGPPGELHGYTPPAAEARPR